MLSGCGRWECKPIVRAQLCRDEVKEPFGGMEALVSSSVERIGTVWR